MSNQCGSANGEATPGGWWGFAGLGMLFVVYGFYAFSHATGRQGAGQ